MAVQGLCSLDEATLDVGGLASAAAPTSRDLLGPDALSIASVTNVASSVPLLRPSCLDQTDEYDALER